MEAIKKVIVCQKICIYNESDNTILLCKRHGEEDFDGVFSFPGGKMDDADKTMEDGIKRELLEELGGDLNYDLRMNIAINKEYTRKDGEYMVLPHYLAIYKGGEIEINQQEYSDYTWVGLEEVDDINCIPNIKEIAQELIANIR